MLGWFAHEALRMPLMSEFQHGLSLRNDLRSLSVMDIGRSQQIQAGMVMLVVIPGEELLAEPAGIFNRAESIRIIGAVLQSSEVGLGERIVIGDVRPAVRFNHSQIGKQQSQ